MAKKRAFALSHWVALAITPVIFACAHATTEEVVDGYADSGGMGPALTEPALAGFSLGEEAPQAEAKKIAAAQKAINKSRSKHKKIGSPFTAPKIAATRVRKEPPEPTPQLVVRNGSALNRYYFVRSGDTPEALSKLFYGSSDRAAELVEWNGPAASWEAGKTLYYRSSKDAADTKLVSYYTEAGVVADEVSLLPGDTLRTFASQRYGSASSWKEIAALNGLREGMTPAPGLPFKAYPVKLMPDAPKSVREVAQMRPKAAKKADAELASASIASFVHHNPLIVACSVVALVLFAVFFYSQRRRYRRFDF